MAVWSCHSKWNAKPNLAKSREKYSKLGTCISAKRWSTSWNCAHNLPSGSGGLSMKYYIGNTPKKHSGIALTAANRKYQPIEAQKHIERDSKNSVGDIFVFWLAQSVAWEHMVDPNHGYWVRQGASSHVMWFTEPKMEYDQQRLQLASLVLPSTVKPRNH